MRFKAVIEYDGTNYCGYQKQVNDVTIQGTLEKALKLMLQFDVETFAASRTDKGVHAKHQVLHFDLEYDIPEDRFIESIHKRLPKDIRVKSIKQVNKDFHARFDSKSKTYEYIISKKPVSAFNAYRYEYFKGFNVDLVKDLLNDLVGTHDFTAFSPNKEDKDPIKTIYSFTVRETKELYIFKIHGNSFLRYMVRSIMGNVIDIALGKKETTHLKTMLETKDRLLTSKTASAHALYLKHIYY